MIDGVGSLGLLGSLCQSSSVTKGMKGCSIRRPSSKHVYRVFCAERLAAGEAESSVMGFIASYSSTLVIWDNTGGMRRHTMKTSHSSYSQKL